MIDKMRILRHFVQVKLKKQHASREALAQWQFKQFSQFAKKTLAHSPFYESYKLRPLTEYPIIDKTIWVNNFDSINTKELKGKELLELALNSEQSRNFSTMKGEIAVGLSSGTSGRRALFVTDKKERLRYAGTILAKCLGRQILKKHRVALLLRANNRLYETIGGGRIEFSYFDLQQPWSETLTTLQLFKPTILIGPPQVLSLIAQAQTTALIELNPEKIIVGAEVLEQIEQTKIEAAFKIPVEQIYQATEGFLGITCRFGTMHLNEDAIIIEKEWLDKSSRRFVPIITDFSRTTQPIVRYRLNDVLVEAEHKCQCGSIYTTLEKIEGREDDILFLYEKKEPNKLTPVMPDFIRDAMALSADAVLDYRLIQHSFEKLEVAVTGPDLAKARNTATENLQTLFSKLNLVVPELIFAEQIKPDMQNKLRRVRRMFPMTEVYKWNAS
jgi:putative adenylate-forming enzyme